MLHNVATWIALYTLGCCRSAAMGQNLSSHEYLLIPGDGEEHVETTERTTILFSGFYLPSTAPPTTLLTDLPEHLETTIQDEGNADQHPLKESPQPQIEVTEPKLLQEPETTPSTTTQSNDKSNQTFQPTELVNSNQSSKETDKPLLQLVQTKGRNVQLDEMVESKSQKTEQSFQPTELSYTLQPDKVYLRSNEVFGDTEQPYHLEKSRLVDDHPCRRDCRSATPMTCRYKFVVEWYESSSKACMNCPQNITDCYNVDCIPTDGLQRPLVVVNRKLPGPNIEVCVGDSVEIELKNGLMTEATTVHWHGLHQKESPYMDGVPYVSQCPVLPKSTFVYRYIAANSGTHFWHSHAGTQRADGMFGALIIRTEDDPHRKLYDEDLSEHTIQVLDWSHQLTIAVFTGHHHSQVDNKPPTLLVNGRGVYGHHFGKLTPPSSFTVQQGKRYRFRLINAGVLNCPVELSIDNHTMLVISSDGSDTVPVEVESLVSYAGERWDFVLEAKAPVNNYWMRFRGLMDCDERFTSAHTVAVLHYINSSNELPKSPVGYMLGKRTGRVLNALNEGQDEPSVNVNEIHSLTAADKSLKPTPDRRVILSYDFYPKDNSHFYKKGSYGFYEVAHQKDRVLTPQFNHVSLLLPPFPLLSQFTELKQEMLCSHQDLSNCSKKYCECLNIIPLNLGEVVELILIDIGVAYDANHPFHLHGHAFRVVAMDRIGNKTTVDEFLALEAQGVVRRNLIDPPIKDTVTVPDGGYTVMRFVADNPGLWMFHCHLEFHVELGMAVIFQVGTYSDFPPPPAGFPKCGNYISPQPNAENEVDWSYNSSKISDGSSRWSNWWPFKKYTNNSPILAESALLVSVLTSIILLLR